MSALPNIFQRTNLCTLQSTMGEYSAIAIYSFPELMSQEAA
jgi:hypothetical protein